METETVQTNGATAPAKIKPAKVSKLKGRAPDLVSSYKPKILLSGKPGTWKTSVALSFPSPFMADPEGGANRPQYMELLMKSGGAYFGPDEGARDPKEIIEQVKLLGTEENPYETFILDSISKVYGNIISEESERLGPEKDVFGASKKPAVAWTRSLIRWVEKIDKNVILIAHERDEWSDQKKIGTTFDAWDKLAHELDLWIQVVAQGKSRVAIVRKSRITSFPENERFPWSYEEFATRYGKQIVERKSKQLVLATQQQVEQIALLLENVKVTEEEISKWFSKANVESWAEMDTATIEKCINFLKQKVAA